jgi:hypothetical protein
MYFSNSMKYKKHECTIDILAYGDLNILFFIKKKKNHKKEKLNL